MVWIGGDPGEHLRRTIKNEIMPQHIGDGAYVSHDGHQLWLRAVRDGRVHEVAIDDEAWAALHDWWGRFVAEYKRVPQGDS